MPLPTALRAELTNRFQDALSAIGDRTSPQVEAVWSRLDSIDESEIDAFAEDIDRALSTAKFASVRQANGYYSVLGGVRPSAISPDAVDVVADTRGPFISAWNALKGGSSYEEAKQAGSARSEAMVRNLVSSSSRRTGDLVYDAAGVDVVGWERVPDGKACPWCLEVASGFYESAESADFGHDRCGCSAAPIFGDDRSDQDVQDVVVPDADARLSASQREALSRSYSQWGTGSRNAEARAALKATADGKTLVRAVDQFQATQGGVKRYRDAVDAVVTGKGGALPVATRENADAILDALRTTEADGKTLFRGLKIKGKTDELLATYAPGETVDLGMSSFSSNQTVANHFMKFGVKKGETQIAIRIEAPDQALPLSNISKTKHAADLREYLAGGRFEVVSSRKTGPNKIALVLRQVVGL